MAVYVALLRGVNVGGKNVIKMARLKAMFESLGFSSVQTYIQSGNILFESNEKEIDLCAKIEAQIYKEFGFEAAAVLRTAAELQQIIDLCPFNNEEIIKAESAEYESFYIALLNSTPEFQNIKKLDTYVSASDQYKVIGRDVYILLHHSIRDSKLAGNISKLEISHTLRNFKTISKLLELAKKIDSF